MDMARTCLPDVIVLDISLPKEDDFGFIGEMKNYPELSGIPVVILTDLGDDENRNKGMSLGAREYLVRDEMTFADIAERIRLVAASSKK
jgi:DNA-binding NarL/FixJ family response regulator